MEVIVVTRFYDYYEESYTEVIGVRESDEEADVMIAQDKKSRDHELMSAEDWFRYDALYNRELDSLMRAETVSPKRGGWVKKYPREQISKKRLEAYDRLCKISGDKSFKVVFQENRNDDDFMWDIRQFLCHIDLTREQFDELSSYYLGFEEPKNVTYRKEKFDTKA